MSGDGAKGDIELIEAVSDHVDRHLGKTESVIHEKSSPTIHLDLIPVPARDDQPFKVVVTCGMAALPMHPPPDFAELRWTELCVLLPPDWPLDHESLYDERNWWPLGLLKELASYPHEDETAVWAGHTITNGVPPEPLIEGSGLCASMLTVPFPLPEGFDAMPHPHHPEEYIAFHLVMPIYAEELAFAQEEGSSALLARFAEAEVDPVIDPQRPSAL